MQYTWTLSWIAENGWTAKWITAKESQTGQGIMSGWDKRIKSKNPENAEIDCTPASVATEIGHSRKI